jgi:hypothetical protein
MLPKLTIDRLIGEAKRFAFSESQINESAIFGITDGKAIGTYIEHKFKKALHEKYACDVGNSAHGIDLPDLEVDIKVTSINQPQSSSPFKSARQKVFGLGYSLLVFVYEKIDDHEGRTSNLNFLHTIFIEKEQTADYQTTSGLLAIVKNDGNHDDIVSFLYERNLPVDDVLVNEIADEVVKSGVKIGCLTISNALQWRLQYSRAIQVAGVENGVIKII